MRISIAIEKFDPCVGGAERYCWDLAHYLVSRGHEIEIICIKGLVPEGKSIHVNFVHPIGFPQWLRHLMFAVLHYFKAKNLRADVNFCVGNTFYMDIYQPHGGVHAAWFERDLLRYPPYVRRIIRITRRFSLKDFVQRSFEWCTYRITKPQVIAISEMVKNDMIAYFKYPEEKITLIPNGINTTKFSPDNKKYRKEIRSRYGLNDDDFVFLFVANNFKLKGFSVLVKACAQSHDVSFKVLVIGQKASWAKRKVKRFDLAETIIFGGHADDLERIYPACDCLVHPTYYDTCALVVLEAMSSGIPVITTNANGASMYITSEEGHTISPGDSQMLASYMKQLCFYRNRKNISVMFKDHSKVFEDVEKVILKI